MTIGLMNALFSKATTADPEALRAAAKREWPAENPWRDVPVETFIEWGRNLHFWQNEAARIAPLDADQLTDLIRRMRELPDGPEQEQALVSAISLMAEQCGAFACICVELASRLETVDARLKLENEADA